MYWRFTDRARKVMQLANQEAQRLNHEYIGTEHILLGLVKEGSGVAANVFKNFNIDLDKIRLEVEKIVLPGPDTVYAGKLPQTPRAKKAIEYSLEEARNLNHNYVGTEHLLLGLLREREGVAAQVLMNLLLRLEDVRRNLRQLLFEKVSLFENSPAPEDLIVQDIWKLLPFQANSNAAATNVSPTKCQPGSKKWPATLLANGVSWGCRHGDLCTFLAGFVMTFSGSLVAWCLGLENHNAAALFAGTSYTFAIALAYWPYWDRPRPGKNS
jgi:hypothetical protein